MKKVSYREIQKCRCLKDFFGVKKKNDDDDNAKDKP